MTDGITPSLYLTHVGTRIISSFIGIPSFTPVVIVVHTLCSMPGRASAPLDSLLSVRETGNLPPRPPLPGSAGVPGTLPSRSSRTPPLHPFPFPTLHTYNISYQSPFAPALLSTHGHPAKTGFFVLITVLPGKRDTNPGFHTGSLFLRSPSTSHDDPPIAMIKPVAKMNATIR